MNLCDLCDLIRKKSEINVLELYSGIGGMRFGLLDCGMDKINVKLKFYAVEININANTVYRYNFKEESTSKLFQRNICSLTANELDALDIDICTMSPPCQPFTRQGLKLDNKDPRTDSLYHLIKNVFRNMKKKPKYFLIENVKGFETSSTRNDIIDLFTNLGYYYQEFLLNPLDFGIPNSRLRYYCIARVENNFSFKTYSSIKTEYPKIFSSNSCEICFNLFFENLIENQVKKTIKLLNIKPLKNYLENINDKSYLIPDKILMKYFSVFDIVDENSKQCCCFTKSYSVFIKGTGSYLKTNNNIELNTILEKLSLIEENQTGTNDQIVDDKLELVKKLNLRYFTPKEISNIMHFPQSFVFPNNINQVQKYKLLGNSVNVKVISFMFKILLLNNNFN